MIRYPEFRAQGWQIGSGLTEAECKTTTHRVKGRGRRWNSDNAETMLALACLHDNGLRKNTGQPKNRKGINPTKNSGHTRTLCTYDRRHAPDGEAVYRRA